MRTTTKRFSFAAIPLATLGLVIASAAHGQVQGPWTVAMRAMENPLQQVGQCTAIEVVVRDAGGKTPLRPDGRQLDWQDFELSFTASPGSLPDAFYWSNERHRFLCARIAAPASATVVAHYPGAHLRPGEFWPIDVRQQVDVFIQGAPGQVASAAAPYQSPAPGYTQPAPQSGAAPGQPYTPSGYQPQPTPYPSGQPVNAAPGYPQPGAAAGGAATGYPQAGAAADGQAGAAGYQQAGAAAGGQAGGAAGYPQAGAAAGGSAAAGYQQAGTAAGGQAAGAAGYPQAGAAAGGQAAGAAGYPQAGTAAGGQAGASAPDYAVPATAPQGDSKSGGFFKRLGAHIKQRASDVKNQTTENLANSANQVVDATTQTGTGLVSGATAQVSSAARSSVGGIGKALLPSKGQADNLAVALNYGQAEFRNRLFSGGSIPVLEPAGRELVAQLAAELKTRPGRFQIQVHVDPIENALVLSKEQAGLFKSALIKQGIDGSRLESVGYGATVPRPEAPPDGGPTSSARLIIIPLNTQ